MTNSELMMLLVEQTAVLMEEGGLAAIMEENLVDAVDDALRVLQKSPVPPSRVSLLLRECWEGLIPDCLCLRYGQSQTLLQTHPRALAEKGDIRFWLQSLLAYPKLNKAAQQEVHRWLRLFVDEEGMPRINYLVQLLGMNSLLYALVKSDEHWRAAFNSLWDALVPRRLLVE